MKLILLAVLLGMCSCISFYAKEGVEKCFQDEIPSRTIVILYHELKSEGVAKNEKREMGKMIKDGIVMRIYDPEGKLLNQQQSVAGPNKYSFTSTAMGRYKFCVFKAKQFWSVNEYKYSLKIQQGIDYNLQDAANTTHVATLADRIDQLKNRTEDFINLQQYNREQEDKLTTQSITINNRVTQTTVLQIIVLIISGVYQIWSLRRFFKSRFLM